jgi:hypothetical protein
VNEVLGVILNGIVLRVELKVIDHVVVDDR